MPCNCGIGTLLVLYVAILAQYPLGQGTPRNLACGYMPRSPGKRVAPCAAWPTLRVVGLCFGFYLLPNHNCDQGCQHLTLEFCWILSVPYLCGQPTIYINLYVCLYTRMYRCMYLGDGDGS